MVERLLAEWRSLARRQRSGRGVACSHVNWRSALNRGLPIILVIALLVLTPQAGLAREAAGLVQQAEEQRVKTIGGIAPAVVAIFPPSGEGGGSGVLISKDGFALTNFHVVQGAGAFLKCGLPSGDLYDAVLVGIDPTGDVALIKLLGRTDFPEATMGDSDSVQVGDWVYVLGNPFLLATDFSPTVTYGIVSGVHRYQYPAGTFLEYADCIQVDASINPGNSGGPLFNSAGELVGINGRGSFEKRGRVNVGAGYAISINQIRNFLDQLKGGRIVDHATLGATVRTGQDREVLVDSILEDSSAYRRGLREGDEVVSLADRPIGSVNQFKNILGIYPKGWKVPLVFRRDGLKQAIEVTLKGVQQESVLLGGSEEKGKPGHPGHGDEDDPSNPARRAEQKTDPDGQLPAAVRHADLHQEKPGYANYHFNEVEQRRLAAILEQIRQGFASTGRWKLAGETTAGAPFTLTVADAGIGFELRGNPYLQMLENAEIEDEPPGTGGFLVALAEWRRLWQYGPEGFSSSVYYGSQPISWPGEMVDVLVTRQAGIESRWFFQKDSAGLLGFDTTISPDREPCEIRFLEFSRFDGRIFPSKFRVSHAGVEYGVFDVTGIDWGTRGAKQGGPGR